MNCKYCNNELSDDAKFCNKCGKQSKAKKNKTQVYGVGGWLSIFIFVLFVSIIINLIVGINDITIILETEELAKSWLYGLVFLDILIFGGLIAFTIYTIRAFSKLKENAVSLGKMYLILIFSINLINIVFLEFTGEPIATATSYFDSNQMLIRSFISSIIWFLYLTFSKRINNTFPKENRKTKTFDKLFFFAIIAIPIAIYSLGFIESTMIEDSTRQQSTAINSTFSKEELIKETVKEIKNEMVLPNQMDEVTKLVDITAQPSAIRYHYILTDINTENLNDSQLKKFLKNGICQNNDTKSLINNGINLEYSYTIEDTNEKYFFTFNKTDCLK